jgi:hypothetical protein
MVVDDDDAAAGHGDGRLLLGAHKR